MPTLTHWIALCGLACSSQAATSASLVARYGLPVMQQFDAAPGIRITVEYGPDRMPIAVQLAPPDYNPHISRPSTTIAQNAVSELIAFFVPTGLRFRRPGVSRCSGIDPRSCTRVDETDDGFYVTTQYPGSDRAQTASERNSVVTIGSDRELPLMATDIQAHFGPPVAEEFGADAGVGLTAKFDGSGK